MTLIPPACICQDAPGSFGMLLIRDPECPAHGRRPIRGFITAPEGVVDEAALCEAGFRVQRSGQARLPEESATSETPAPEGASDFGTTEDS